MTPPVNEPGPPPISPAEQQSLLDVARRSIRHGLDTGKPLTPADEGQFTAAMKSPGASFVTLNLAGSLRGCIGSLEPRRPLVEDVAQNAFAAAFRDPRFPPLSEQEYSSIDLHISVLGPASPMDVADEASLHAALRPGVDGLILDDPPYRSVFLPQVWESLPDPRQFVEHLKLKAGLRSDHWSPSLRFSRFHVIEFGAEDQD